MRKRPTTRTEVLSALNNQDGGRLIAALADLQRRGGGALLVDSPLGILAAGPGAAGRLSLLLKWRRQFPDVVWSMRDTT